MRGQTGICNFDGIMEKCLYIHIIHIPCTREVHPDGHQLMADNDSKHTSRAIDNFWKKTMYIGGVLQLSLQI